MKGTLITFEGAEGSGKSTQAALILQYLKKKKLPIMNLREPGGVKISEKIRGILLDVKNTAMADACETLLYMAARAQLVKEVIAPALERGKIILCDRFLDSTVVYQGYGNGVDINRIKAIGQFATSGISPDLTLIFDIDTREGLSRAGQHKDRIERRSFLYHNRVRQGYLALAKKEPKRIRVIKVNDRSRTDIQREVRKYIDALLLGL
jgi:dTMP kinase